MTEICSNCGTLCCGVLMIQIRRECYYPFCSNCFYLFNCLKIDLLREVFKHNDNYVTL